MALFQPVRGLCYFCTRDSICFSSRTSAWDWQMRTKSITLFRVSTSKGEYILSHWKMEQERWEVKVDLLFLAFFLEPFASSQVPLPSFHLPSVLVLIRRQGDSAGNLFTFEFTVPGFSATLLSLNYPLDGDSVWQPRWGISPSTRLGDSWNQ